MVEEISYEIFIDVKVIITKLVIEGSCIYKKPDRTTTTTTSYSSSTPKPLAPSSKTTKTPLNKNQDLNISRLLKVKINLQI